MKKSELRQLIREVINTTSQNSNQAIKPGTYPLETLTFERIASLFPEEMGRDGVVFPTRTAGQLTRVKTESDFEKWKEGFIRSYGNVKVEINPNADWFAKIKIVDDKYKHDQDRSQQAQQRFYDSLRYKGD